MSNQDLGIERWPDEALLRAAHAGNQEAFAVFCTRSMPSVLRFVRWQCRQLGVSPSSAKDFANDVIVKALAQAKSSRDQNQPIPKISFQWLFRIAHNLVVDWVRRNRRRAEIYQERAERLRAAAPSESEQDAFDEVLEFFVWLPANKKDMLELVFLCGLSPEEAGEQMGLKKWAAHKLYERALQHLRDLIREHGRIIRDS